MHQQQGPPAAGGVGMTIGCRAGKAGAPARVALPTQAHQPGLDNRALSGNPLTAQHELAMRAVGHLYHPTLYIPIWIV